jgi:nucleoporin p58/p45
VQQVGGAGGAGGVSGGAAAADAQSNTDLISFFSRTADEMDEMMKKFERNLGEIEVHLHGVQGNMLEQMQRVAAQSKSAAQGGVDERVIELAAVLRDFEESILKVAGVVGGVKEGVTELQLKDFMGHGS